MNLKEPLYIVYDLYQTIYDTCNVHVTLKKSCQYKFNDFFNLYPVNNYKNAYFMSLLNTS